MSNVSHSVSLYTFSSDISFVVPVAIVAASVWIFSRSSFSYCVQLSQIRFALRPFYVSLDCYEVMML